MKLVVITIMLLVLSPVLVMIHNLFGGSSQFFFVLPIFIAFYVSLLLIVKNIGKFEKKEFVFLFMFYFCGIIASILSKDKFEAFFGSDYRLEGVLSYLSYLGFFYCGYKVKLKDMSKVSFVLVLVALIISFFCLMRFDVSYRLFDQDISDYYFYQGPFSQFNHFGYYLLIANFCSLFLFLVSKSKRFIYLFIYLVLQYILIINDTFGVYLAYLFGLMLFVYLFFRRVNFSDIVLILLVFFFMSLVTYRDGYNVVYRNFLGLYSDAATVVSSESAVDMYAVGTNRGELWVNSIKLILERPYGYGFENVKYEYHRRGIWQSKPHNLILNMALDVGVVGMFFYFVLLFFVVKDGFLRFKLMSDLELVSLIIVCAYLVSSMFGNSMFYTSPYFYLFLGVVAKDYKKMCNGFEVF